MLRTVLFICMGYLSGSVLYALVFAKIFHKGDILEQSSDHNPGTANAFMYGGFWCGLFTLLLMCSKDFSRCICLCDMEMQLKPVLLQRLLQ